MHDIMINASKKVHMMINLYFRVQLFHFFIFQLIFTLCLSYNEVKSIPSTFLLTETETIFVEMPSFFFFTISASFFLLKISGTISFVPCLYFFLFLKKS